MVIKWYHDLKNKYHDLKKLYGDIKDIVGVYHRDQSWFMERLVQAENIIKDRTDIHVDINTHSPTPNTIIVIGKYKSGDYIQTYNVRNDDMTHLITILKDMERYGTVRTVDAIPSIRGFFSGEFGL